MIEKAFTLKQVLEWASEITGDGVNERRTQLVDLVRETLEALHNEESIDTLRKWCIPSCGCTVTIPKEMAEPLKYKVGNKVGPVRNQAYEFLGYVRKDCTDFRTDLEYQGEHPIFFDLPSQGGRVAARSLDHFNLPSSGSKPSLLVQGKDIYGKEVFGPNNGTMDVGEVIEISQPDESPVYSRTIFKEITSVRILHSKLNIQFVWCNAKNFGAPVHEHGLLAFYDPGEELPTFRRYGVPAVTDCSCCFNIELLGYLRIPSLRYDNELIRGFDSGAIRKMIRANWQLDKNDLNGAQFNASLAATSIRKKNERRAKDADNLSVDVLTSAASFQKVF